MEKRIDWIDFAKGFTILFVVLFHTLAFDVFKDNLFVTKILQNYLGLIIATFIMPSFFVISGYLYKDINKPKEFILLLYKKISAFFIPYIIFTAILIVQFNLKNYTYHPIIVITYMPAEYMWFLYVLTIIFGIFGVINLSRVNIYGKCFIVFVLFLISKLYASGSVLYLSFIFMPFFFLGYLLRRYININSFFNNKFKKIIMLVIALLCLIVCKFDFNLDVHSANMNFQDIFAKIFITIIFIWIIMKFKNNKFYVFMKLTGKYSLVIYLVHYLVVEKVVHSITFMNKSNLGEILSVIIGFVVGYAISLFVTWLCRYKVVSWIFFPRRFIDPLVKKTRFGKWIFS